jgi:hypothetical protein
MGFLYEFKTITQDSNDGYPFSILFVMVLEKFSGKKNRDNYKGKSENSDKLQTL